MGFCANGTDTAPPSEPPLNAVCSLYLLWAMSSSCDFLLLILSANWLAVVSMVIVIAPQFSMRNPISTLKPVIVNDNDVFIKVPFLPPSATVSNSKLDVKLCMCCNNSILFLKLEFILSRGQYIVGYCQMCNAAIFWCINDVWIKK